MRDYYSILGVPPTATAEAIRSGYRRLALKFHPDVCSLPDAAERFVEAKKAYDVLREAATRRAYDTLGRTVDAPEAKANAVPTESPYLHVAEPEDGFAWARQQLSERFEAIWSTPQLAWLWRTRAGQYWQLEGERRFNGAYYVAGELAAEMIYQQYYVLGVGVSPEEGIEWGLQRAALDVMNGVFLIRIAEWKRKWKAKAESAWVSHGKLRSHDGYLRAAMEAGRSVCSEYDEERTQQLEDRRRRQINRIRSVWRWFNAPYARVGGPRKGETENTSVFVGQCRICRSKITVPVPPSGFRARCPVCQNETYVGP